MKKVYWSGITALLLALVVISCEKQEVVSSEPTRYRDFVFENTVKNTVVYSDTFGLEMDIYYPENDNSINRPVIFLGHGGGFYFGSKENPSMIYLAERFAKRGYVTVAFNYQLAAGLSDILDSVKAIDLVVKSVGDARAAVRYMRKSFAEGNAYGIDPNRFFIGGNSAGAVLATHIGFFDEQDQLNPYLDSVINANGGFHGFSGNLGYSSSVSGVFNLAGGIISLNMIDANDAPIYNAHGDEDDVVPIECGDVYQVITAGTDVIDVCGSIPIDERANLEGVSSELNVLEGGHVPWLDPNTGEPNTLFGPIENDIVDFLYGRL